MGLTQDELSRRIGCAPVTIRKIEYDDLRPSIQIAERLAMALAIALEERGAFVRLARAERAPEPVTPTPAPRRDEIGQADLSSRAVRGYALGERIGHGGMGAEQMAAALSAAHRAGQPEDTASTPPIRLAELISASTLLKRTRVGRLARPGLSYSQFYFDLRSL